MAILLRHDSCRTLESPLLLASLNTFFVGGLLLAVLCMATKSYQASGSLTFLMMGCGALFVGVSSLMAGWTLPITGNPNSMVTLHNIGCLFAGLCHVASAHFLLADLVGAPPPKTHSRRVGFPYAGILLFLCVVAALEVQGSGNLYWGAPCGCSRFPG
jgi:hypothetical protein